MYAFLGFIPSSIVYMYALINKSLRVEGSNSVTHDHVDRGAGMAKFLTVEKLAGVIFSRPTSRTTPKSTSE